MLAPEAKNSDAYQEAYDLMETVSDMKFFFPKWRGKHAIRSWQSKKLKEVEENYEGVPSVRLKNYRRALKKYTAALIASIKDYKEAGSSGRENILERLLTDDRSALGDAIRALDNSRGSASDDEPKKPNWLKRILIGGAIIAAGYFGVKQFSPWNGPQEKDKDKTEEKGKPLDTVRDGDTFRAPELSETETQKLRNRLERAQLKRMIAEEEARESAAKNRSRLGTEETDQQIIRGRLNLQQIKNNHRRRD